MADLPPVDRPGEGAHRFPGVVAALEGREFFTSDCEYGCGAFMGSHTSGPAKDRDPARGGYGDPRGVGTCPNAPAPEPVPDKAALRAAILSAFGVTEADIAAVDPDGSYEEARRAAVANHDAFFAWYQRERDRLAAGLTVSGALVEVEEGWWHPDVKSGQVHLHPDQPKGSWSIANHRSCVPVYTKRGGTGG